MKGRLLSPLLLAALLAAAAGPAASLHPQSAPSQAMAARPALAGAQAASPAGLVRPDGTLRLDGQFTGALDLRGWDVRLDPQRGPVFGLAGADPVPPGQWASLGGGATALNGPVNALAVSGTTVYAGGQFLDADSRGNGADDLVKWDASAGRWSAVDPAARFVLNNSDPYISALAVSGGQLYVGGTFAAVSGPGGPIAGTAYLAEWDGAHWLAVGGDNAGGSSLNSDVFALVISGTALYVGGNFTDVNNWGATLGAADYVARWDLMTHNWSALGYGANSATGALNQTVRALARVGAALVVGGDFTNVNNQGTVLGPADYLAQWDAGTSNWAAVGHGKTASDPSLNGAVWALATDGSGNLFAGGMFTDVAIPVLGPMPSADYIARWDGSIWARMGSGATPNWGALNGPVNTIVVSGTTVYAGGSFTDTHNGGTVLAAADYVAAATWNGAQYRWTALSSDGAGGGALPLDGRVSALALDGAGRLYVGGSFDRVSDNGQMLADAAYLASWNGTHWAALPGQPNGALNNQVSAVAVNGADVYVGGSFHDVHDGSTILTAADSIARWDGVHWSALGSDGAGGGALQGDVATIAVLGTLVYAGGLLNHVVDSGSPVNTAAYVALWDGTHWHALGSNGAGGGALNGGVFALAVNGADLYAGGIFSDVSDGANPLPQADYIARWSGGHWSALGSNGLNNGALNGPVEALAVSGSTLYAGGGFTNVNDSGHTLPDADYVARWDMVHNYWSPLGQGQAGNGALNSLVVALAVSGNNVYVGGAFTQVHNQSALVAGAASVARWNASTGQWAALGGNGAGGPALNGPVMSLALAGNALYVGGQFTDINDGGHVLPAADDVARWDIAAGHWSALGSDGAGNGALSRYHSGTNAVSALAIQGQTLFVGGSFLDVSNSGTALPAADNIAMYGLSPLAIYLPLVRR